jgi:hypothetical protein
MANSGVVSPGINFKRDESSSSTEAAHGDCEGSVAVPIFAGYTGAGFEAFRAELEERMAGLLNSTVPDNYTVAGWNSTSS